MIFIEIISFIYLYRRLVGIGVHWVGLMLNDYSKINKIIHLLFEIVVIDIIFSQLHLNHKAVFIILELNIVTVSFWIIVFFIFIFFVFIFLGSFSFYHGNSKSQCTSPDVVEFIENTIEHSKSGQFMFFIRSHIPG
jgi:hypothetical protein